MDRAGEDLRHAYRYFTTSSYAGSPAISLFWNPLKAAGMRDRLARAASPEPQADLPPLLLRAQRELEAAETQLERETDPIRRKGKDAAIRIVRAALYGQMNETPS